MVITAKKHLYTYLLWLVVLLWVAVALWLAPV